MTSNKSAMLNTTRIVFRFALSAEGRYKHFVIGCATAQFSETLQEVVIANLHFSKLIGVSGTSAIEFDLSNSLHNNWYSADYTYMFDDVPEEDFFLAGSLTFEEANVTEVPEAVDLITPADNASGVGSVFAGNLNVNFMWNSSPVATGYKLYIGETLEFGDPAYDGNTVSKRLELEYGKTYLWKVVPYNEIGDAVDCPVGTFTTMDEPVVGWNTFLGEPAIQPDNSFNMPVTVQNFVEVGAISLTLGFNPDDVVINVVIPNV